MCCRNMRYLRISEEPRYKVAKVLNLKEQEYSLFHVVLIILIGKLLSSLDMHSSRPKI